MNETGAGARLTSSGGPLIRMSSRAVEAVCWVDASAEAVWELLVDTTRWLEWGPSIVGVQCSGRFIDNGSSGQVKTILGCWLPFVVTQFEAGRYWSWKVLGIRATGHRVEPLGDAQCRLVFEVPLCLAPYVLVCSMAVKRIARIAEERRTR
jgi:hypothetical protein